MRLPLRENGIWLTVIALVVFTGFGIAEMWAVDLAGKPVTVHLGHPGAVVKTSHAGTALDAAEEVQLVRSEEHRRAMADAELQARPAMLLERLASLEKEEGSSPALLNDMGVAALRAGLPDRAVEYLKSAASMKPDYPRAWYNLGVALGRVDRDGEAVASYRAALDLNRGYQEAAMNLGLLLRKMGQLESAIDAFTMTADISSTDTRARALYLKAEVLASQGRLADAAATVRSSIEYDPRNADSWWLLGKTLYRLPGEEQAARSAIEKAVSLSPDAPQIHLSIADELDDMNRPADALAQLQTAIRADPANIRVREEFAELLKRQGDFSDARTQYQWLANHATDEVYSARMRAEIAMLANDTGEAIRQLQQAIENNPEADPDVYRQLGLMLRKADNHQEALAVYETVLSKNPGDDTALVGAAAAALAMKQYAKAEKYLGTASRVAPRDPDTWFMLGRLGEARSDFDAAITAYEQCLLLDRGYHGAALNLAVLKRKRGDDEAALEIYWKILEDNPRYSLARYNLAVVLAATNNDSEAADQYEEVLKQDPENEKARLNLAVIRRAQGRLEDAETLLRDGLAQEPSNVSARFNLALLLGSTNRKDEQQTELERIVRLQPDFYKAWRSLGRIYENDGKPNDAAQAYLKALHAEPEDTLALVFNLAVEAKDQGNVDLAERLYRSLLDVHSGHDKAAVNLAAIRIQRGDQKEAISLLRPVLASDPRNGTAMFNLALALENDNRINEAIDVLSKLVELEPNHARGWEHLAICREENGDLNAARAAYQAALALNPDDGSLRGRLSQLDGRTIN